MKKQFLFLLVCIVSLPILVSSCKSTYGLTGQAAPMSYTDLKPDQIKANFDFNLKERKVGEAKATYLLGFIRLRGDNKYSEVKGININNGSGFLGNVMSFKKKFSKLEKVKSAAVYNAINSEDCDIIVNPQYEVVKTPKWLGIIKTYKVKVRAYNGKIKEIYQEKIDLQ